MILHLVTDEKFTDYAIQQFSGPGMNSEFVLIPSNFIGNEGNVKLIEKCRVVKYESPEFAALLNELGKYKAILFHGLFWKWAEDILKAVPQNVKLAWFFWGGEIYARKDLKDQFLMPYTKKIVYFKSLKNKTRKSQSHSWYELPLDFFRKIDYCVTDMEQEYNFAKSYLHSNMQMLWHNYYSIEDTVGTQLFNQTCNGNNIFIGNSASVENNHTDLFLKLRTMPLKNRQLIVPLSNGAPWYKNVTIKLGKTLFGSKFLPLVDFMERTKYNETMLSCSTMIQPHYRAQAQGNIITGLWLGMRVYLYECNFAYQHFSRLGIKIYSIEKDLNRKNKNLFEPMSAEDIRTNREILLRIYGRNAIINSAASIVNILNA